MNCVNYDDQSRSTALRRTDIACRAVGRATRRIFAGQRVVGPDFIPVCSGNSSPLPLTVDLNFKKNSCPATHYCTAGGMT